MVSRAWKNFGGAGRNRTDDKGFADLCLTTWRPRPLQKGAKTSDTFIVASFLSPIFASLPNFFAKKQRVGIQFRERPRWPHYSGSRAGEPEQPARPKPLSWTSLTLLGACCTIVKVRALSSAVRAFGLHPKGRPFKSDSAHHKSRATGKPCSAVKCGSTFVKLGMWRIEPPVMHGATCSAVRSTCDVSPFSGDVVQLVRTLPCHGRGREFESRRPRHSFQALAESLAFRRGNKKEQ